MAKVNIMSLREDRLTKPATIRWGFDAGGTALYTSITIPANEHICPDCEGAGTVTFDDGVDGFQKLSSGTCERCDGEGSIITEEHE